jgi:aminoglycoside/choline kinase family phosphotransferase
MSSNIKEIKDAVGFSDKATVKLLAGDASTRKYYRVIDNGKNFIVVESAAFSKDDPAVLSNIAFKKLRIPVPEILKIIPEKGLMVKEDLGSTHLQDIKEEKKLFAYYDNVVDIMLTYQTNAIKTKEPLYPLSYSFTKEKFISELNMTTEYYFNGYKHRSLNGSDKNELESIYDSLVDKMMKQDSMLLHRDYHSRNIMVNDGKLFVIDYQDARLGPYTYDLASLVIDPYITLSEDLKRQIIARYYNGIKKAVNGSISDFEQNYYLCFLQRGIKILGTFAYQKLERNNDRYLQYIDPSIKKINVVLDKFPEWKKTVLGALLK